MNITNLDLYKIISPANPDRIVRASANVWEGRWNNLEQFINDTGAMAQNSRVELVGDPFEPAGASNKGWHGQRFKLEGGPE